MKKVLALFVCTIMTVSMAANGSVVSGAEKTTLGALPVAANGKATNKTADSSSATLESTIKAVKSKITIPDTYSEFEYHLDTEETSGTSSWNLSWRNPKDESNIEVSCDQDYHIVYYSKNDNSKKSSNIPAYLKSELKSKAEDFIKKLEPKAAEKLSYQDATYQGNYENSYLYTYERKENGVIFPDNTISVGINCVTGEVVSVKVRWLFDEKVPSSEVKLTKDEAANLLKKEMTMKLAYHSADSYINERSSQDTHKAYLVYEPSVEYISVDAKTGKIYKERTEWDDRYPYSLMKDAMSAKAESNSGTQEIKLTEAEIKKVEELKNLISKTNAVKAITGNKYLYQDKNMKVESAALSKSYREKDSYVWNIILRTAPKEDKKGEQTKNEFYADAEVDAATGRILSYYSNVDPQYNEKTGKWDEVKIAYSKKEAGKIFEKFLQMEAKAKFKNAKLTESSNDYVAYYKDKTPVYGGYNYNYVRTNEGVEYAQNNISGAVDGITGKVYNFRCYWDTNVKFESKKGAMTAKQAMEKYLSMDGYGLKYEIAVTNASNGKKNSVDKEIRLVYRADVEPSYISPFTGVQLDNDGKVYAQAKPYAYRDIKDTKENREILLLSDMNIGFEGENFQPTKEITRGELKELMNKLGYEGKAEEKDTQSSSLITRQELAQDFIVKLRLEKVAGLQGIYNTGYADQGDINQKYLGSVALAKGLNLMEADADNKFYPEKNVTRADAVHYILAFIGAGQSEIYN